MQRKRSTSCTRSTTSSISTSSRATSSSSARIVEIRPLSAPSGLGRKSKTLSDTMEDILLEDSMPLPPAQSLGLAVAEGDDEEQDIEVSDLGVTVAQPDTGALRPTLIIG